jgi:bisphosphoglycerate-independent phosphoglycerate mutase (AlkP superfamily)
VANLARLSDGLIPLDQNALASVLECCKQNGFVVVRLVTETDETKPPEVHMVMRQTVLPTKKSE